MCRAAPSLRRTARTCPTSIWRRENEALRRRIQITEAEITQLQLETARLQQETAQIEEETERLQQETARIEQESARHAEYIDRLREEIARQEVRLQAVSAGQPMPAELPAVEEAEEPRTANLDL